MASLSSKELRGVIKEQMLQDLNLLLDPFKNKEIGLRILSEKTKISEKTFKRMIRQGTDPHTNTIRGFYQHFFQIYPQEQNNEVHRIIKKIVAQEHLVPNVLYKDSSAELEEMLETNKVFRQIYLYSRCGHITKKWVQEEFGRYGIEILELMISENLLLEIDKNIYVEGPMGVPKNPHCLKIILSEMVSEHLNDVKLEELGKNFAFYLIEGVTEETRQAILRKMAEMQQQIGTIINGQQAKGDLRLFALGVVDTLKEITVEEFIKH